MLTNKFTKILRQKNSSKNNYNHLSTILKVHKHVFANLHNAGSVQVSKFSFKYNWPAAAKKDVSLFSQIFVQVVITVFV